MFLVLLTTKVNNTKCYKRVPFQIVYVIKFFICIGDVINFILYSFFYIIVIVLFSLFIIFFFFIQKSSRRKMQKS